MKYRLIGEPQLSGQTLFSTERWEEKGDLWMYVLGSASTNEAFAREMYDKIVAGHCHGVPQVLEETETEAACQ